MKQEKYQVTGMRCAGCQANIEKSVRKVTGVTKVEVSLLTGGMTVEYEESQTGTDEIIRAVTKLGFKAEPVPDQPAEQPKKQPSETDLLRSRVRALRLSIAFLIPLSILSMAPMLTYPQLEPLRAHPVLFGWLQFLLLLPVIWWNRHFFTGGFKSLIHGVPNMDTLVALGSGAGILYGLLAQLEVVRTMPGELYFEASAMILVLISLGKYLEFRTRLRTGDAIEKLLRLAPDTASVIRNGKEIGIPVSQLLRGDVIVLRPGNRVPVDGTILEGSAFFDQSAVTGESIPVEKMPGDTVISGTQNTSGLLKVRAEKVGSDTTLARIAAFVREAGASKAPVSRIADRVSGIFVPVVIAIALIAFTVWLIAGASFHFALTIAISVLLVSCPCALGLAAPAAVMAGTGRGAGLGILFRSGEALETLGKVTVAIFDKTGTLTMGTPEIAALYPAENVSQGKLLETAAGVESGSRHPFAAAFTAAAKSHGVTPVEISGFQLIPGRGIAAVHNGKTILAGNIRLMEEHHISDPALFRQGDLAARSGKTILYFAEGQQLLGAAAIADPVKPESARAIRKLQELGIRCVMLTGDNEVPAHVIAENIGITEVHAEVMPEDKAQVIRTLQSDGDSVVMIGDGINDAPALVSADVGIAIGSGTEIAIDSADVILMRDELTAVADAVRLSRAVIRNIKINLVWAFFYNALCIPLAAGVFYPLWGWMLRPVFSAAAMSISSVCVVTNALRLRFFR